MFSLDITKFAFECFFFLTIPKTGDLQLAVSYGKNPRDFQPKIKIGKNQ